MCRSSARGPGRYARGRLAQIQRNRRAREAAELVSARTWRIWRGSSGMRLHYRALARYALDTCRGCGHHSCVQWGRRHRGRPGPATSPAQETGSYENRVLSLACGRALARVQRGGPGGGSRRAGAARDGRSRALPSEGQAAVEVHDRGAERPPGDAAVRGQAGLRGGQAGLHRRPPYKQIMAEAGNVAWDMASYEFLLEGKDFDSIHPSLQRQAILNMAYGLYEVVPGQIYQVRGFDLGEHQLHQGRHRLDRVRPADRQGDRRGGARVRHREARQAPGAWPSSTRTRTPTTSAACAASSTRPTCAAARSGDRPGRLHASTPSPRTSTPATR